MRKANKTGYGANDIRAALNNGRPLDALRMAAGFSSLGEHKDRIQKAWAAHRNPSFYRELGQDPETLITDGVAALRERYGA